MYQLKINQKIQNQNNILKWFLIFFFIHKIVIAIITQYAKNAINEKGIHQNQAKSLLKTDVQESCEFISQAKEFASLFFIKNAPFVK